MEDPVCVLCCYSFPPPPITPAGTVVRIKTLDAFLQQTGPILDPSLSAEGLLINKDASVCGDCFSGVSRAAEKRTELEEVEGQVQQLQRDILRLMHQLQKIMVGYLEEMRGLQRKISLGDEGCLKARFSGRRGRLKKGAWSKDNIFQLRRGIINVVKELSRFRDDVSAKCLPESAPILDEMITSLKQEPDAVEPITYDNDYIEDPLGFSSPPPGPPSPATMTSEEEDDDKDDSADSDFVPDTTSAPKCSPTRATKNVRKSSRASRSFHQFSNYDEEQAGHSKFDSDAEVRKPKKQKGFTGVQKESDRSEGENELASGQEATRVRNRDLGYPSWATVIQKIILGKPKSMSRFFCLSCPKFLARDKFHLEHHLRLHESSASTEETKLLTCPNCPKTFTNEQYYELHIKCHDEVFTSVCDICWKPFSPMDLQKHLEEDHGATNIYHCPNCIHVHSTRDRFLRHFGRHSGKDVIFGCGLCSDVFASKAALQDHLKKGHVEADTIAKVRLNSSTDRKSLNVPRRSMAVTKNTEFPCEGSSVSEDHNPNVTTTEEDELDQRPLKTKPAYYHRAYLKRPDWFKREEKTLADGKILKKSLWICTTCSNFETKTMCTFDQHLRAHEKNLSEDSSEKFSCYFCPATFRFEQLHQFHELCHRGSVRAVCDACPPKHRQIISVFGMKQHLETAHGINTFIECAMCVLIHSDRVKYIRHLIDHHQQRQDNPIMACDLCPETKTTKKDILDHYQLNHGFTLKNAGLTPFRRKRFMENDDNDDELEDDELVEDMPPGYLPRIKRQNPPWYTFVQQRLHGKSEGTYTCVSCPHLVFPAHKSHYFLEQHLRLHERELEPELRNQLQCPHCPATFGVQQYLEMHVAQHQGLFRYVCELCRIPKLACVLRDHLEKDHVVENVISCGNCSMLYSSRNLYMYHLYRVHGGAEAIFNCDLCSESPSTREELILHYRVEHQVEVVDPKEEDDKKRRARLAKKKADSTLAYTICPECGGRYRTNYIDTHIKNQHHQPDLRPYVCEQCGKRCKSSANLMDHIRSHKKEPSFQCHICSKSFRSSKLFKGHMKVHEGTGWKCNQCDFMTSSAASLKSHEKKHSKQWFHCDQCSFKYPNQKMLDSHKRNIHDRGKVNVCPDCGKAYPKPYHLRHHILVAHKGEKPFKCKHCSEAFTENTTLRNHVLKTHPGMWYSVVRRPGRKKQSQQQQQDNITDNLDPKQEPGTSCMTGAI